MKETIPVYESSGNVFADLGLPDAEEAKAKAGLAQRITEVITLKGLTQVQAAELLGIDQPKISHLLRGRLTGFSTDRLLKYLTLLDQDIQIIIRSKAPSHKHGTVSVTAPYSRTPKGKPSCSKSPPLCNKPAFPYRLIRLPFLSKPAAFRRGE